ncbi:hypothetical protein [Adhaeribacter pallidiroseus]|uniref:Uncharacterized protein n=1 Tax=Adhaeribacter pallidiroseus TaxID=2072847 RepID=A0A369QI96_9BACT|nr:hypothetical protein [Adhaeribacter pallidiroseus]RDC64621.1 hypothetical protein AHMF7616_03237 [Adhaeribacter pallidiroseus]
MKRFCTLLFFVLFSLSAYAQAKKDNTITIATSLPVAEAFTAWGKHLAANGFTIDKSDPTFYTISTGQKDTSRLNCTFVVNSSVSDSGQVVVRLKLGIKASPLAGTKATDLSDWQYGGMKGSPNMVVYQDILKVINSFGQYPVTYSVK